MAKFEDRDKLNTAEQKLWDAMADGEVHEVEDLCLMLDSQMSVGTLRCLMSSVRVKIRRMGLPETVIFEDGGYRKVRYINAIG